MKIYTDTKANIEALSVPEGFIAYASDTNEMGSYNGSTWDWISATSVGSFLDLTDTLSSYSGYGSYTVTVKDDETGLEFVSAPGGASTFLGLTDTPSSYSGYDEYLVKVSSNQLTFTPPTGDGGTPTGPQSPVFYIDGPLASASDVAGFVAPCTLTIEAVYIWVDDPGTAGSTIINVRINGSTAFITAGNKPTVNYDDFDNWDKSGEPDLTAVVEGDVLTVDIDQVATGASGLSVVIAFADNDGYLAPTFFTQGNLAVTTDVAAFISPADYSIEKVYIWGDDLGTASGTTIDIHKDGTTIFTTQANRPTLQYDDADSVAESGKPDVSQVSAGDVLTLDIDGVATGASGLATTIKFSAPTDLSIVRAKTATATTLTTGSAVIVAYDTEEVDTLGEYDPDSNYRFTAKYSGWYAITASLLIAANNDFSGTEYCSLHIYKGGANEVILARLDDFAGVNNAYPYLKGSTILELDAGEYIDIRCYQDSGINQAVYSNDKYNFFTVERIPSNLLGYSDDKTQLGGNLIKNSPGQVVTDGAEPQWWDDSGSATITDEDTSGESIPVKHERCFKVVTTASNHYGYQTFTFADEELLTAGSTIVSFGCWVYAASINLANVRIYGTNLGTKESEYAAAGKWTWLTVENIELHASDTSIEIRLAVQNNTAYFTMPMLVVGSKARPWAPRDQLFIPTDRYEHLNHSGGDIAYSDLDLTAGTDNLAIRVQMKVVITEPDGSTGSWAGVGHDSALTGADRTIAAARLEVVGELQTDTGTSMCDDQQVTRYRVNETDADADLTVDIDSHGYWRWA